MHTTKITTRTLPPTETKDKRVCVRTEAGTEAYYPWDHRYDVDQVHENAARKVAVMENPNQEVTMQVIESDAMGYVFRAVIGRVAQ